MPIPGPLAIVLGKALGICFLSAPQVRVRPQSQRAENGASMGGQTWASTWEERLDSLRQQQAGLPWRAGWGGAALLVSRGFTGERRGSSSAAAAGDRMAAARRAQVTPGKMVASFQPMALSDCRKRPGVGGEGHLVARHLGGPAGAPTYPSSCKA